MKSYEELQEALSQGTAIVYLDVRPPRNAPTKQILAYLFERAPNTDQPRPQGEAVGVAVTPEQAHLLVAGAEWKGPAHMRAELF
jgi:hypothetical protein